MSPVSWGDIFTLLLRGDRIMELKHAKTDNWSEHVRPATMTVTFFRGFGLDIWNPDRAA